MSNKLFQGIIFQMHEVTGRKVGVIDRLGAVVACSDLTAVGELRPEAVEALRYSSGCAFFAGYYYSPVSRSTEYMVFVEGGDRAACDFASVIAVSIAQIKELYDDKYDTAALVKNIILENILPTDIYLKSKDLNFPPDVSFVTYLVKFADNIPETPPLEIVRELTGSGEEDGVFVIAVNEREVALVRELSGEENDPAIIEQFGVELAATISAEFLVKTNIGIGSRVNNIKDLARSYKEAQLSLEVGRVFEAERTVCCYENLGIGRLIYQLPVSLCEMFLTEVFKKNPIESIDRETLETIQFFFENNLNVSEASRKLFIHRNTLVYRLEKIRRITGLDLREFDHAITFKMALMIKKYMNSKTNRITGTQR